MSFFKALTDAQDGLVVHTLDERFRELQQAVLNRKEKGVMTLKVIVTPEKFNSNGEVIMVGLDWQCEIKKPSVQPGSSIFFVTDDQELSRDYPGQERLFQEQAAEEAKGRK